MKRSGFKRKSISEIATMQEEKRKKLLSTIKDKKSSAGGKILTKKPKVQSVSQLKKKLWTVFSLYIRQRDKYTCFTCGRIGEGGGMHAGHFVPKSVGGIDLYFDEDNVHAQCYNCNINLGGNQYVYSLKLGEKAKDLYWRKGMYTKWTIADYEAKIEYYKNKV